MSSRYTVEVTHDGEVWVADVPALEGAHTQAGNLTRLDEAIREVIALVEDLPEGAESTLDLDYKYEGLDRVARAAALIGRHRAELERVQAALAEQTTSLVRELSDEGWSVRDAAHLLGISPGRVSQIRGNDDPSGSIPETAKAVATELNANAATGGASGETQLRSVVEAAGMLEHVTFDDRPSPRDTSPARPDMIVRLPGGKSIAIEAKVPFNAYLGAAAIPPTASDSKVARRVELTRERVKSVRAHITAIGSRSYWNDLEPSPDMVVAFVPSESLLSAVLEADPSIMEYAFSKHVALASPVTLFSVLKAVAVSWRHEAIIEEARAAFDVTSDLPQRFSAASRVVRNGKTVSRATRPVATPTSRSA